MGLSVWQEKQVEFFEASATMDKDIRSLSAPATGDLPFGVLACWTLIAACIVAAVIARLIQLCNAPSGSESLPRQAAKRRTPSEDTSQAMDSIVPEDISKDYVEVTLERSRGQSWGLVWHVQAYESERFLIAGLEPKSPAGLLKDRQAQGLRPLRRGDELVSVNGTCYFQSMRRQLERAQKVRLQFLKADVVMPLECDSCESPTATTKPDPETSLDGSTGSPSSQSQPSQAVPPICEMVRPVQPSSPTEVEVAEVAGMQCSTAFCAVEHSLPALPAPDNIPEGMPESSPPLAPATVRGRDIAVKRADVPNWCKEKRKSRRHASAGEEEGRLSSGSGSGSEQVSGESKCPSTDWEYMMDNRPGSLVHADLLAPREPLSVSHSSASNVVIVAGSQAVALQTASALGTV
ncbi:unnamed protein product, partial [Symbiodinium pilosum]